MKHETDKIKLQFYYVAIEMTRQCNLACAHCARGEAQNKTIKPIYIDRVLDQIDYVNHFVLTGGEPSLHPDLFEYIIDKIIEKGVRISYFDTTLNGTIKSERVAAALDKIAEWCHHWQLYAELEPYASVRISSDLFHRDFPIYKPEEAMEFYKNACKSKYVVLSYADFNHAENAAMRKTGRSAHMSAEDQKRAGFNHWSVSCPYRRFDIKEKNLYGACRYAEDGSKIADPYNQKWIDTGIYITACGKFLKSSFVSYDDEDALAQDSVMTYSLYECIKRWNARYPLYYKEAHLLYRDPVTVGADHPEEPDAEGICKEVSKSVVDNLIEIRQQIQKAAPQLPFSMISDATLDPFARILARRPTEEIDESRVRAKKEINQLLMASLFMPKPKEPRTYDEMMDYLETY